MTRAFVIALVAGAATTALEFACLPLVRRLTYLPPSVRTPEGRRRLRRFEIAFPVVCGLISFVIFLAIFSASA